MSNQPAPLPSWSALLQAKDARIAELEKEIAQLRSQLADTSWRLDYERGRS